MPPVGALRLNPDQASSLSPSVIEIMDKAVDGIVLLPREAGLLLNGLHALAAVRCQGVFCPLMRWIRSPNVDHERTFGYDPQTLPGTLLSLFDGHVEPLIEAIEDRHLDGLVRWNLFNVLARLVFDGKVDRDVALALIDRFDRDRLADNEDPAWAGWQHAIALLGIEEWADRVHASWQDGRNPEHEDDQLHWRQSLDRAFAEPLNPERFVDEDIVPLEDAVTALKEIHDDRRAANEFSSNPGSDLLKDPAARIALNDDEVDWLHRFLHSSQAPDTAMELEEIDGFFTALIAGPVLIMPSTYLPVLWGGDGEGPVYDSLDRAEHVSALLMRHWNTIACRLNQNYPCWPLMAQDEAWPYGRLWAQGFARGVALCSQAWEPLFNDEKDSILVAPIIALEQDDLGVVEQPLDDEGRAKMVGAAIVALSGIHHYWHGQDKDRVPAGRKIGRNQLCPCGSGKKYKRCCGSPVATTIH
ncbi:MAG: UPF0149 family protein [Geminicoccaceae bacterium]